MTQAFTRFISYFSQSPVCDYVRPIHSSKSAEKVQKYLQGLECYILNYFYPSIHLSSKVGQCSHGALHIKCWDKWCSSSNCFSAIEEAVMDEITPHDATHSLSSSCAVMTADSIQQDIRGKDHNSQTLST